MRKAKACISFLSIENSVMAEKCLNALLANTDQSSRYLLIDNGSQDNGATISMYKKFYERIGKKNCTVIQLPENMGFIDAHNYALKMCAKTFPDTEYFVLINDDMFVNDGWLDKLLAPFADPKIAVTGIDSDETCNSLDENFKGYRNPKCIDPEYVEGSCMAVRFDLAVKHGLFDSGVLKFAYCEDSDLCLRMQQLGYKVAQVKMDVQHLRAVTAKKIREEGKIDLDGYYTRNHTMMKYRWARYLSKRNFDINILVRRDQAFGDVLCIEPVIRLLHENTMNAKIFVETRFGAALENHPNIQEIRAYNFLADKSYQFDAVIPLDNAYENRPGKNIILSYLEAAGIKLKEGQAAPIPRIYFSEEEINSFPEISTQDKWVGFHVDMVPDWVGRSLSPDKIKQVHDHIHNLGYQTVLFGKNAHFGFDGADLNLIGKTKIREAMTIISRLSFFIGMDSGLWHVAQSCNIPNIVLFGCVLPETRVYNLTATHIVSRSHLGCIGCHSWMPGSRQIMSKCARGTPICMDIPASAIIEVFEKVTNNARA